MRSSDGFIAANCDAERGGFEGVDSHLGKRKRNKPVACQRCHARKVKCSGEQPCGNCKQSDQSADCVYPERDRQVTVSENYLNKILEENARLCRAQSASRRQDDGVAYGPSAEPEAPQSRQSELDSRKISLLEEPAWFVPTNVPDTPFLIGEAADAAFSTRVRQTLMDPTLSHIPRTHFITDESLLSYCAAECPWPTLARARFLVNVAFDTVCTTYHLIRKDVTMQHLEQAMSDSKACTRVTISKLWALFALGELHSVRVCLPNSPFPGVQYFCHAFKMLSVPVERPSVDIIEVQCLFSIYSLSLNRRHAAWSFASSAIRTAVILGLHVNVPASHIPDRSAREHRNRLWWTVFILDSMCAVKLTQPGSVPQEFVETELPSDIGLTHVDFGDPQLFTALVKLVHHASHIISDIYRTRKADIPFSQRVQKVVRDLRAWLDQLPEHLRLDSATATQLTSKPLERMHLMFNQCVILATRPVLRHILSLRRKGWTQTPQERSIIIPDTVLALGEACIRCARHSHQLLIKAWIGGSFATFVNFDAQHLFSSAVVLLVSSLMDSKESSTDLECFEAATQILGQLELAGNLPAQEFGQHIRALDTALTSARREKEANTKVASENASGNLGDNEPQIITAGMVLSEPSLQDFLAQPNIDFGLLDTYIDDHGLQNLYGTWMPI